VDVSLNDTLITSSANTYGCRAYIETLLSYGSDAKSSQLTSALFYKDEAGKMDKPNPFAVDDGDKNSGLVKRQTFAASSGEIDMIGRIHFSIFFQERYMLNEVNVRIKLIRSNDAFLPNVDGATQFKVVVTFASLLICKVKITPSVYLAHAKTLESDTAKYPIRCVVCKTFTVPTGYLDASHEKLFSGQLPIRLIVGLVDNRAYNGSRDKNPFNFHHYSLSEIAVYLDGQLHGLKPLKLNFGSGQYVAAYSSLFGGTNKINRDEGNDISRSEYANGHTLFAYDLTPDLAEDDHLNLTRQATVRLDLKFAEALAHTVTVVCYAEFHNVIEVDRIRTVVFDFNN
jgi:hypothetical protein